MRADGDCFEIAGRLITNILLWGGDGMEAPTLVHATITGQGPIEGLPHVHAWIEHDKPLEWPDGVVHHVRMAIDRSNGKDLEIPAVVYRNFARIHEHKEYTPEEARQWILKEKHWGPWELSQ
jgi:hypothetical protein